MQNKPFTYWEHCGSKGAIYLKPEEVSSLYKDSYQMSFSKTHRGKDVSMFCYEIYKPNIESDDYVIKTNYFIGVDWIEKNESSLYIAPKINSDSSEVDYLKMLFNSLRHPQVSSSIHELFQVKWDEPSIKINQKQDLLTPFLVVEFLSILKIIVKKGLKKSYFKVEKNLQNRVKGKVLVSKTIKHNVMQNKLLNTYCNYEEFGINNKENRLLKKALEYIKRYLPIHTNLITQTDLQDTFNFINPAFEEVSTKINIYEVKHLKTNVFYKEYSQAIKLAQLILKRFGYNISNTVKNTIKSPPFWIDMSKLFELYVLGMLKDRFGNLVDFQLKIGQGNELDYLLRQEGFEMVIDAKYKPNWMDHSDVRQVSGYSRLKKVYDLLGKQHHELIEGLIIYPNDEGLKNFKGQSLIESRLELDEYSKIYKLSVKLPLVQIRN